MITKDLLHQNTICAIATPQGGAIGIVRVSGNEAIAAANAIFRTPDGQEVISLAKGYSLHYGVIKKGEEIVDEVLVSVFRAPHSYTGEDCVEISCHGSAYILERTLTLLTEQGCVLAQPGEFTQRAFFNGKMDLSQAEAVADLIASKTAASHRLAVNQLRGGFSRELRNLRERLLHVTSLLELELDFSDHEDLEFADRSELLALVAEVKAVEQRLIDSFRVGNAFKNGVPAVIVGETNAGKSTLLNALVGEDRAIVSDIHGTTRDVIEDVVNLGQVAFRFIDTAGIRQTTDTIENLGIERSLQKLEEAAILLWVIDGTAPLQETSSLQSKISSQTDKPVLIIFNKSDLIDEEQKAALVRHYTRISPYYVFISAREQVNLDALRTELLTLARLPEKIEADAIIVSNVRHLEALNHSYSALTRVEEGLALQISGELIAMDLREAIRQLADITGDISSQDVLTNIFRNFCIGK